MTTPSAASPKLNANTLANRPELAPAYDRTALPVSVLHLGPSAFFRAHQADYFDRLNTRGPQWGIKAVALRTRSVPDALIAQDGLYTLLTLDNTIETRIIGALIETAFVDDAGALSPFTSPNLKLVTMTVTEKGYCLDGDGLLDFYHPDIVADLATPERPHSVIGVLAAGLSARRAAGLAPPIILPCDNLPDNGAKVRGAVVKFATALDANMGAWIGEHVRFLSCMVDSITPATDAAIRSAVADRLGIDDAWPIQREAFTSWVIEACDAPQMPDLASVGAVMTRDVEGHEQAKLRLLNGAHSTLAYYGLAHGFETVAAAMADPEVATFLSVLMREEIAPSLDAPDGLNLDDYCSALLARFANRAIAHKLAQIAWDGSQKLPIRLLATMTDNLKAGRSITHLATGVAAWCRFIVRRAQRGMEIVDPMADTLANIGQRASDNAHADVSLFLQLNDIFPENLAHDRAFKSALEDAYGQIMIVEKSATGGAPWIHTPLKA